MDNLTKEQRRKNMQRIRAKDTGIELRLRKALWHKGYRYRKNDKNLPGKPDIVLTKYKIAIFCDSEFFHGKDWEVLKPRIEKGTNSDYWLKKISNNRRRDDEVNKQLLFRGWTVIRFWGKDIQKNLDECVNVVEEAVFDSKMDEAADLEEINLNMDTMAQINSFFYERLLFNKKQIAEHVPEAEVWDLYNENRELLGKEHIRGEQMPIDGYHLVVHVWIRNSKGEYLISQRSANRPTYPLMWECVGGSVVKGEDSLQGAIREAKEEVGVDLEPGKGQVLFSKTRRITDGKIYNDIVDVWLFDYDGEVDLGKATTDEVAQVTWMKREQIKKLFEQNVFVDTQEYFFTEVDRQ